VATLTALRISFAAAAIASFCCGSVWAAPCGELPEASAQPTSVHATGRWETCKPRIAPGCEFGAYQTFFWRVPCLSSLGADYDIWVAFEWIEGQPLLPGQPDANNEYRGLPYVATIPHFNLIASRTVVRLSDGRTTTDLAESETAVAFRFVGIVDRYFLSDGLQLMPGVANYKFCPSSTRLDFCNGVAGSINAMPIFLDSPYFFSNGFE